jgi:hypothetical protein
MNREPECGLGLWISLLLISALCWWAIYAHPTNEERANMLDSLPTKNTQSTGVTWR